MPIASVEDADYELDGDAVIDDPNTYARKSFAFFLHEIGKNSEEGDTAASMDYFATTMVLGRVRALLVEDPPMLEHAIALIEYHRAFERPAPEGDLPAAADLLK